jgi:WAS/WASL-interacting protein
VRALSEAEPAAPRPGPPPAPSRASLAPPPVRQRTISAGSQPSANGSNGINARPAPPRRKSAYS